jgi:hypothetical protein
MVLALAAMLGGCTAIQRAEVSDKEDLLAAAGFVQRPANTPDRQAMLTRLPAHRFVRRVSGEEVSYLFADPLVCNCLYVGTQAAYGRYQQIALSRRIAEDRVMAAQMEQQAAMDWGWGPWGGPGFWY